MLTAAVLLAGTALHAGESAAPVKPENRDAEAGRLVDNMEAALAAKLSKITVKSADFFPAAKKRDPADGASFRKKLAARLALKLAQIKIRASNACRVCSSEFRRMSDFIEIFRVRGEGAANSEFDEKIKDIENRPLRERNELFREAQEEHRRELERIRKAVADARTSGSNERRAELVDELKEFYEQYVRVLKMLLRLGEKKEIPSFEDWSKTGQEPDRPRQPRRKWRNPWEWEEPKEKKEPGRNPFKPRFPGAPGPRSR